MDPYTITFSFEGSNYQVNVAATHNGWILLPTGQYVALQLDWTNRTYTAIEIAAPRLIPPAYRAGILQKVWKAKLVNSPNRDTQDSYHSDHGGNHTLSRFRTIAMQMWKRHFWPEFTIMAKVVVFELIVIAGLLLSLLGSLLDNELLKFIAEYTILDHISFWVFLLLVIEMAQVAHSGHYCSKCGRRKHTCLGDRPLD